MAQYYQQLTNASQPVIYNKVSLKLKFLRVSFHLQIHLVLQNSFWKKKKKVNKTPYNTRMCIIIPLGRTRQRNHSSSHTVQKKSTSFISMEELSVGTILQ